jgi:hypothetical protein
MKKFILLTAPFLIFSCSISEMEEVDKLNEQIGRLKLNHLSSNAFFSLTAEFDPMNT